MTQEQDLQQFIEASKTNYSIQKGNLAANEYMAIIIPYVNQIISLQKQIKKLEKNLPKNSRIVKKGKK